MRDKLREVAKLKMADLNTTDEEMAMRIVAGSARQMGVKVAILPRRATRVTPRDSQILHLTRKSS